MVNNLKEIKRCRWADESFETLWPWTSSLIVWSGFQSCKKGIILVSPHRFVRIKWVNRCKVIITVPGT